MSVLVTTAYLPSIYYMAEVMLTDEIVIEVFETYRKQTGRNHAEIYGPNGKQTLSIPVIKANGNHTLTKDILISNHQPWQKIHWRSIKTAYNNSPFFLYYQDHISRFYKKEVKFLLDFNIEILQAVLQALNINRSVRFSELYEKTPSGTIDLRTKLGAKYSDPKNNQPHYTQVFEPRHGFIPGLSILDLIFNLGPEANFYLETLNTVPSI